MINHILFYPRNKISLREGALSLLKNRGLEPKVFEFSFDDPEYRNNILLLTSVGEFEGLEGIDFYLSFLDIQKIHTRAIFNSLADEYLASFNRYESVYRKNPFHRRIVSLGESAIPMILERLEENPHAWFLILGELTREPIPELIQGDIDRMVRYFREFEREKKYTSD